MFSQNLQKYFNVAVNTEKWIEIAETMERRKRMEGRIILQISRKSYISLFAVWYGHDENKHRAHLQKHKLLLLCQQMPVLT
jgi:hypothetical protein